MLPNCISPVIVQGTFIFAAAVLGEAALSFLGVGVPPQIPSWGNVLAEGRSYLQQAPWLTLFPGAAIMASILGLNLFGDGLRDLLDPKLRGHAGRQPGELRPASARPMRRGTRGVGAAALERPAHLRAVELEGTEEQRRRRRQELHLHRRDA